LIESPGGTRIIITGRHGKDYPATFVCIIAFIPSRGVGTRRIGKNGVHSVKGIGFKDRPYPHKIRILQSQTVKHYIEDFAPVSGVSTFM
jgi:hypothetical protein